MISGKKIGFIGGGQMGEAIFSGILASGQVAPGDVAVTDVNAARLEQLAQQYGVRTLVNDGENTGALQLVRESEIVVFAVKPQFARPLLGAVAGAFAPTQLVVSIMGGITLDFLARNGIL